MHSAKGNSLASTSPKNKEPQDQQRPSYANTKSSSRNDNKSSSTSTSKHSPPSPSDNLSDNVQVLRRSHKEANAAITEASRRLGADFVLRLHTILERLSTAVSVISIDALDDHPDEAKELYHKANLQCLLFRGIVDRLLHEVTKDGDIAIIQGITTDTADTGTAVNASSSPSRSTSRPRTNNTVSCSPTGSAPSMAPSDERVFEVVESRPIIGKDGGHNTHKFLCGGMLGQVSTITVSCHCFAYLVIREDACKLV